MHQSSGRGGSGPGRPAAVLRILIAGAIAVLAAVVPLSAHTPVAQAGGDPAAGERPCDIYSSGGTPCVGAYSTVRSLYSGKDGPLYQVTRESDRKTLIVASESGYADVSGQDSFCRESLCRITRLIDQSPMGNDLAVAPEGGYGGPNKGVIADALPVTVNGHRAYGMKFTGEMGYRNATRTRGVAPGSEPESMYMLSSNRLYNAECCFTFGNTSAIPRDNGNGHMDSIYYGSALSGRECVSPALVEVGCRDNGIRGPMVAADLENGIFRSAVKLDQDTDHPGADFPFATAVLKNDGKRRFSLRSGDAHGGALNTHWDGSLPGVPLDLPGVDVPSLPGLDSIRPGHSATFNVPYTGYMPMKKEGGIGLGVGGDNANLGQGIFFEGALTDGYPSSNIDDRVHADIVAAGYSYDD